MLGFIKGLLGDQNPRERRDEYQTDNKLGGNPINELQILDFHTDIVRILLKVDEIRIASGADDGLIVLWHIVTGERVGVLKGHLLPITCLMLLERYKLISGSADKCIRIWDLKSGACIRILKGHEGSVKCMVPLGPGRFCSGGNDRLLLIWKNDGDLVSKIERREEENIQCLLPISNNRIITGSNSSLLLVYKTDASKVQILAYHRESVRCLVRISASLFASGSMDGAVVIWQTESLTPIKVLNNPEKYRSDDRIYVYNVKHLLSLGEKYLAAAIGKGFKVYDIDTEECIMDCSNAHDAEVNSLISVYDGLRIVSCSTDSCIKIWGTTQRHNFRRRREKDEDKGRGLRLTNRSKVDPVLLGEMWAHSDSVYGLLACTENSFASCGGDGSVILWKDGRVESELRNLMAAAVIRNQSLALETDDEDKRTVAGSPLLKRRSDSTDDENSAYYTAPNLLEGFLGAMLPSVPTPVTEEVPKDTSEPPSGNTSPQPTKPTRVPDYIFDFAERLRKEKKLTVEQVSSQLRQLGHSEAIVNAVAIKQQNILIVGSNSSDNLISVSGNSGLK